MRQCRCSDVPAHARVRHFLSRGLCRYGHVVERYPWLFIVVPALVFGGLGAGLLQMERSSMDDDVNMPTDSQSRKDQIRVQGLFPDHTRDRYDALELTENQIMGSIIFRARNNTSVYDALVLEEIRLVIDDVKAKVTALVNGTRWSYADLCGRRGGSCVVTGERLLDEQIVALRGMGLLSYPKWKIPNSTVTVDLSFALADADKEMKRVGAMRVTFKLRHDMKPEVFAWEDAFVEFMKTVKTEHSDIVFSSSRSCSQEVHRAYQADLIYIWLALGLIALCTCVIAWGGDVVSTRALLVPMGVVPPALGIIGAMGFLSLCGVKVVDAVWVMPLLILGVDVMHFSLLMASWSARLDEDVPRGVAWNVADVAPACGVTSLSLFVAFCVTYSSTLPSVSALSLYAGVSVLFTYITTMTLGVGCLAVHARRVDASRHVITCTVTSPRDQLKKEGTAPCVAILCGGSVPRESYGDQGVLERAPGLLTAALTRNAAARVGVGVVYLALLAAAIYGLINLKRGMELKDMLPKGPSTCRDYLQFDSRYFGFSFPVLFVMDGTMEYDPFTANLTSRLLRRALRDPGIDESFVRCWLTDFMQSPLYENVTEGGRFAGDVVGKFLNASVKFLGDVVMDRAGDKILASRCYAFSKNRRDHEEMARLMQRMRSLAADAGFPVFAYHPAFLAYDQRLATLPALYQSVGAIVLTLIVMYVMLFPEPYTTIVVIANVTSTVVGSLGLMHFWDVSISFVLVTHVLLGAGFAVCLSVPVAAAFLQSTSVSSSNRVAEAAASAAAPALNTCVCVVIGLIALLAGDSYPLNALFKILLLTLLLALFHAVFFTPTLLSVIGPHKSAEEARMDENLKAEMKQLLKKQTPMKTGHDSGDIVSSYFRSPEANAIDAGSVTGSDVGPNRRGTLPLDRLNKTGQAVGKNRPAASSHSLGNGHYADASNASVVEYHNGPFQEACHSVRSNEHGGSRTPDAEYSIATVRKGRPSSRCNNSGSLYKISACVYCRPSRSYSLDAINRYENWRYSAATGLYENWPDYQNAALSHYSEEWPGRYTTVPSELYSVPEKSAYSEPKRRGQLDSWPFRSEPRDGKEAASPGAAKRSAPSYTAILRQKMPRRGRQKPGGQADIVASLDKLDEVNRGHAPNEALDQSVASLENVHHVACTLSANGLLGSSQSYITEKFRDIPA